MPFAAMIDDSRWIFGQADIRLASREHDTHLSDAIQIPAIVQIRYKIRRAVVVAVVVVIIADELMDVEGATHMLPLQ